MTASQIADAKEYLKKLQTTTANLLAALEAIEDSQDTLVEYAKDSECCDVEQLQEAQEGIQEAEESFFKEVGSGCFLFEQLRKLVPAPVPVSTPLPSVALGEVAA